MMIEMNNAGQLVRAWKHEYSVYPIKSQCIPLEAFRQRVKTLSPSVLYLNDGLILQPLQRPKKLKLPKQVVKHDAIREFSNELLISLNKHGSRASNDTDADNYTCPPTTRIVYYEKSLLQLLDQLRNQAKLTKNIKVTDDDGDVASYESVRELCPDMTRQEYEYIYMR